MEHFMKNPTRYKVNESYYFLSMMKNTFKEEELFSYNLSAFISAIRSITFFMQKQYNNHDGFLKWYAIQQEEMGKDQDLNFLNDARIETIHKKPIGIKTGFMNTFLLHIKAIEEDGRKFYMMDGDPNKNKTSVITKRTFAEYDAEIIDFSEKQLEKLEKIVSKCETQFHQQE